MSSASQSDPSAAGRRPSVAVPDPPDFTKCIAAAKKTAPKPAKGQPTPTDATLKAQCQQEYDVAARPGHAVPDLRAWIQGEAADQGVKITDAEVKKQFDSSARSSRSPRTPTTRSS